MNPKQDVVTMQERKMQSISPQTSSLDLFLNTSNTSNSALKELIKRKAEVTEALNDLELQIYQLEGTYLATTPFGNIIHGWDRDGDRNFQNGQVKVREADRLFSKSSVTSAAAVNSQFIDMLPRSYVEPEVIVDEDARINRHDVLRITSNQNIKVDYNVSKPSTNRKFIGIDDSKAIIDVVDRPKTPQTELLQRATVVLETKISI
ncbi:uncharacterized protein LOC119071588 [Bradysia coprophila]|uniref:uncharacterized protein LOC119071588 n=1 Tax=Bradysia coprophila TaxID=38358 RepID=UPI00187DB3B7|nr:uncharacterized protein LOC119071588 [Bradysia coprophila]